MDILHDMGVSKLSAKYFFFKVNNSFKCILKIKCNWMKWTHRHAGPWEPLIHDSRQNIPVYPMKP